MVRATAPRAKSSVHRVQRVPVTSRGGFKLYSQWRAEAEEVEVEINPRPHLETCKSAGPGQHVNKTESASISQAHPL